MAIPWDLILQILFEVLENCDDTEEGKLSTIQNRPLAVRFAVTRALRQSGMRGRDLRVARQEVIKEINETPEPELSAFVRGGAAGLLSFDNRVSS